MDVYQDLGRDPPWAGIKQLDGKWWNSVKEVKAKVKKVGAGQERRHGLAYNFQGRIDKGNMLPVDG